MGAFPVTYMVSFGSLGYVSFVFCSKLLLAYLLREFTGAGHGSREKLEFKHRLSIALGAAKGDLLPNQ